MRRLYWQAQDWSYANWMYQHDAYYRKLIEDERRAKEEERRRIDEAERQADARNPLMTKFTKQVIDACLERIAKLREQYDGRELSDKEYGDYYCAIRDVYDLLHLYQDRLAFYRGEGRAFRRYRRGMEQYVQA